MASKKQIIYYCKKRDIEISQMNYCDYFEKKRSTLVKRCCRNCKYLTDEKKKQKTIGRKTKKESKEVDGNQEETKTKKEE